MRRISLAIAAAVSCMILMIGTANASGCPDIDGSGEVDDLDLLRVLFNFGQMGEELPEDIDGNGVVDDADLQVVLVEFGTSPDCGAMAQEYEGQVDPTHLACYRVTINRTMMPRQSRGIEHSDGQVEPYTTGLLGLTYTGVDGALHGVTEQVIVDNQTQQVFTRYGQQVETLADVFRHLPIDPLPGQPGQLWMSFDHPLVIRIITRGGLCGTVLRIMLQLFDIQYKTDKGREVESSTDGRPGRSDLTQEDADRWLQDNGFGGVQKLGPPTDSYNCHGYTFTKGHKWVSCDQVEKILNDNGYQQVNNPRAGDIVVYRHPGGGGCDRGCHPGDITHTGKVVQIDDQGPIIESKWGRLGLYRHRPNEVPRCYGTPTYYRINRAGRSGNQHLLNPR
jgi:hypothetical protein